MKFRVNSPKHSEDIQRELFRLGFEWISDPKGNNPKYTNYPYLYTDLDDMTIQFADRSFSFADRSTETTLEELKAM